MTTKRYRKSNKSKELTYEDIKGLDLNSLTSEELEQYGLGSWLKKNAGVIGTVVGAGAGMLLGPAGSIAGASLGASIGGSIGGAVSQNESTKEAVQAQNAQAIAVEQQQMINNKTQELNSVDIPLYSGVMRRGGRIRKMEYGGEITTTKSNSGPKTSSNLITLSKGDKALQKKLRNYQGILTNAYADTFKSYVDVEKELRNKYNDPYKFDRRKLDTYAQDFINTYGDLALTPEQMRSALGEEAYVDYVNSMNQYLGTKYFTNVGTNMAGAKEDNSNQLRFGPRQIIERYNWNLKDNTSPYTFIEDRDKSTPKKKYGGTLNYGGQLHEGPNGGVPVDAMGNPNSMNPVALVEKGEVSYNTPDGGTYIYSDTLKLNKNKTFAKQAKNIQSRYKFRMKDGVITDSISKKSYDSEMQDLLSKQEKLRSIVTPQEQPMMRTGGNLPEYDPFNYNVPLTGELGIVPQEQPWGGYWSTPALSALSTSASNELDLFSPGANKYISPTSNNYNSMGQGKDFGIKGSNNFSTPEDAPKNNLYQGMNWAETRLAAAPSIAGSALGLILENRNKNNLRKLSLGRVSPQQINLGRGRRALRESANLATTNLSRGIRGAAPTSGGYMANMVAGITDIDRNLSNQMSESYTKEELQNAQLRQQADLANMNMATQEEMYNTQLLNTEDAQKRARINAYISQAGQGITGALNQRFQSQKDADFLNMLNPNYVLYSEGTGLNRRRYYRPR